MSLLIEDFMVLRFTTSVSVLAQNSDRHIAGLLWLVMYHSFCIYIINEYSGIKHRESVHRG